MPASYSVCNGRPSRDHSGAGRRRNYGEGSYHCLRWPVRPDGACDRSRSERTFCLWCCLFPASFRYGYHDRKLQDLFIGRVAQRTDEDSDRHLTVTVDTDGDGAGRIRFQFYPRTAVRDQLRGIDLLVKSISFALVVYARGTNQLGYDDTLGAIDDECTCPS